MVPDDKDGEIDYAYLSIEEMDAFTSHAETYLGESRGVLHEIVSDIVHLDVLPFPPTKQRPCWTFLTMGMSALEMNVPEEIRAQNYPARMELMISLPHNWIEKDRNLSTKKFSRPEWLPIGRMKSMAQYIHGHGSYFLPGHTFSWEGLEREAAPDFPAAMVFPTVSISENFIRHRRPDGEEVIILAIWPIKKDELDFKLIQSDDALLEKLGQSGVTDVFDPDRKSVLRKKSFWKFWD